MWPVGQPFFVSNLAYSLQIGLYVPHGQNVYAIYFSNQRKRRRFIVQASVGNQTPIDIRRQGATTVFEIHTVGPTARLSHIPYPSRKDECLIPHICRMFLKATYSSNRPQRYLYVGEVNTIECQTINFL